MLVIMHSAAAAVALWISALALRRVMTRASRALMFPLVLQLLRVSRRVLLMLSAGELLLLLLPSSTVIVNE
jgi:hypothetical protein